jgi:4-hydroxy-tetrahydrodipicolinate reductase
MIAESRKGMTQPLIPGVGQEARGEVVAGIPIHSLRVDGVSAKQDVLFGGKSELLTISHETTSVAAYAHGILLTLRAAQNHSGLLVGLQSVVDSTSK